MAKIAATTPGEAGGFVATEGNADSRGAMTDFLIGKKPLGRIGQPQDIAAAVDFAIGDDAAWVTGTAIDVSGGVVF